METRNCKKKNCKIKDFSWQKQDSICNIIWVQEGNMTFSPFYTFENIRLIRLMQCGTEQAHTTVAYLIY